MKNRPFLFTLILWLCLSSPMAVFAQTVEIPDANLRASIESALGKASDNPITVADMAALTFLNARAANISDLTGLESASNLTYLFLWDNAISDLTPLADLNTLQFLDLQGNSVSDLSPVMGLTNLIFLGVRDNAVSDLTPVAENTGLGEKNTVNVKANLLNYPAIYTHIPTLQSRGVEVLFDNRTPTTPQIISGDDQSDIVRMALAQPFVVEVRDENGKAFEAVPVAFTVTAGGGTVQPEMAVTDTHGRASCRLTLGSQPGANTVELSVERVTQTAVFSAEATLPPPMPTEISIVSGNNQSAAAGEALTNPFVVEVRDQYGAPVEGVTVTFTINSGSGWLSLMSPTTDANGRAESTLTIGSSHGEIAVEVSVEGIAESLAFNALVALLEFELSVPKGISLIHVPLNVSTINGMAGVIESVADLYVALGGVETVNFLITFEPETGQWRSYLGELFRGTAADKPLTDDTGIVAVMKTAASVRLGGTPLGNDGNTTITLNSGLSIIGLPLRDPRINRVSDLFSIEGFPHNVFSIIVSDNRKFKSVQRVGDDGDIPVTGGQAFIIIVGDILGDAAAVAISGEGWTNISETAAAPPIAVTDAASRDATPVLALTGSIVGERSGFNRGGFHVTVKNISTGGTVTAQIGDAAVGYQLTFVDMHAARAARIGDMLEISAQSADPSKKVQPLRYTVTAEDVKRKRARLEALVAFEIPSKTELLPNYPNPFNPETWIPYRLAHAGHAQIAIYDINGALVRQLNLGNQTAGYYTNRSRAAYWDGKNALGETVTSGVYFYHLSAGDYSATRKMLILK